MRAGRGEVALVGEVRPLADADRADQFGNEEVQVRIALAVAMGAHVDRHAVDRDGEIGAVVEVEAAQEILVRFAFAAVLGDDQAGRRFQHFAGARGGLCGDTRAGAGLLAGAVLGLGLIAGAAAMAPSGNGGVRGSDAAGRGAGVGRSGALGRRFCCGVDCTTIAGSGCVVPAASSALLD